MARGAGGSDGGTASFVVGLIMMIGGAYLLLNSIIVRPNMGLGAVAFNAGGFPVTSGFIMIPLAFGIGFIFYNSKSWIGWIVAGMSIIALVFGVVFEQPHQLVHLGGQLGKTSQTHGRRFVPGVPIHPQQLAEGLHFLEQSFVLGLKAADLVPVFLHRYLDAIQLGSAAGHRGHKDHGDQDEPDRPQGVAG